MRTKQKANLKDIRTLILAVCLLALTFSLFYLSRMDQLSSTQTESRYGVNNISRVSCSYMIYIVSTTTYAQDCSTGTILSNSANAVALINDAIGNLTSGGKILIKAGTYSFTTAPISLGNGDSAAIGSTGASNIELYGEGNATILAAGTNLNGDVIGIGNVDGWYIHDLQVDGNRASQSATGANQSYFNGIELYNSKNSMVERCYVHDDKTYGIVTFDSVGDSILDNVVVNNNANGIFVFRGSQLLIQGNTVDGASDVGISIGGYVTPLYTQTNVICTDNVVKNVDLAISPFGGGSSGTGQGIYVGDNGPVAYVTVSSNIVFDVGSVGIDVNSASPGKNYHVNVEGNVIYDVPDAMLVHSSIDVNVLGNTIANIHSSTGGDSAVYIDSTASSVVLDGNTINNDTTTNSIGITDLSSDAIIESSMINGTQSTAVALNNANNVLVQGNSFINPDLAAGYTGAVNLFGSSSFNTISDNLFVLYSGNDYGIQLWNRASNNTLSGNIFKEKAADAPIYIQSSTNVGNIILGNNFAGTGFGYGLPYDIEDKGASTVIENNVGYNPQGHISSPFISSGNLILDSGGATTPVNATAMTVYQSPKLIMVITGTYTIVYTLVIKIDGTQVISINNPAVNLVFSFQLRAGETFYCQYHTSQTTFVVSGE